MKSELQELHFITHNYDFISCNSETKSLNFEIKKKDKRDRRDKNRNYLFNVFILWRKQASIEIFPGHQIFTLE